ncbi:hypothetical protein ACED51_14255 [Photobacterium swingsii]|uniref:hypothetical protein n=1 Tax=Photobacterium swingsii TaxID=680026 RepID=UPI00352FC356
MQNEQLHETLQNQLHLTQCETDQLAHILWCYEKHGQDFYQYSSNFERPVRSNERKYAASTARNGRSGLAKHGLITTSITGYKQILVHIHFDKLKNVLRNVVEQEEQEPVVKVFKWVELVSGQKLGKCFSKPALCNVVVSSLVKNINAAIHDLGLHTIRRAAMKLANYTCVTRLMVLT